MTKTIIIPIRYPYKNELTPSVGIGAYLRFQAAKRTWHLCTPNAPASWRSINLARRVSITRLYSGRQRPFDIPNLYYPLAFIIDNLVKRRWLPDDDPRYLVDVRCSQRRCLIGETKDETVVTLQHEGGDETETIETHLRRVSGSDVIWGCARNGHYTSLYFTTERDYLEHMAELHPDVRPDRVVSCPSCGAHLINNQGERPSPSPK
jgi:hypothetical protein